MDSFVKQYLETALWSSTGADGEEFDSKYDIEDFSDEAIEEAIKDCKEFREKAGDLLSDLDETDVAHDFWLTRNGHGAGFWDGDYEKSLGDKLTQLSKEFGESHVYEGSDDKLYLE